MLNAVDIDISRGKSTVLALQPGGTVLRRPFDVVHSSNLLDNLSRLIQHFGGETRVTMECMGRYREPISHSLHDAGALGSAVNPYLIKNFCGNTIRKVGSDPADPRKTVRYVLDNRASLRQYSTMDTTRTQFRAPNSQMNFFTKQEVATRTNLILLLDMTYSGVNSLLFGLAR